MTGAPAIVHGVDPEVSRLMREERLIEAAALASSKGDARTASELYERACDFTSAAREAARSGDGSRAMLLAVTAGDDSLATQLLERIDRASRAPLAARLAMRGDHAWAARVFEEDHAWSEAASAWERAGEAVRAAELFDKAKDPVTASKVLEAAIRREPARAAFHLALGRLLLRYGKHEAAVRSLQKVADDCPERRLALAALVKGFNALGMERAASEAAEALGAIGGAPEEEDDAPRSEVKRRIYGRYDVLREVASTASARVLECIDSIRNERVAVKIMSSFESRGGGRDALARFEREVRVLGTLEHPNVVPLRDYVPEGPAMVLAWMSGGTLEQMLQSAIAPSRAVEIAVAVLSALGEAHRLGVLHRDVKPANVLFDDSGVARLADFGVAHLGDLSATATAGVIGTLAYMSPEQREGRPATVQSDLYGVGVILFEMLTGERVGTELPKTRPSGVHRDLDTRHDEVVMRFIATAPSARPSDAFAARRELGALPWPHTVEPAALRPRPQKTQAERPSGARLGDGEGRTRTDRLTGRTIERVPLDDATLARASAFARAQSRALQPVLRVAREDSAIWLEAPRGRTLDRPLSAEERSTLSAAIAALHAQGYVHGRVDRAHVYADGGEVLLAFAEESDPTASPDTDFAQLARLSQ